MYINKCVCVYANSSEKPSDNAGMKNSQMSKIDNNNNNNNNNINYDNNNNNNNNNNRRMKFSELLKCKWIL